MMMIPLSKGQPTSRSEVDQHQARIKFSPFVDDILCLLVISLLVHGFCNNLIYPWFSRKSKLGVLHFQLPHATSQSRK
jgi:hypothetical protein